MSNNSKRNIFKYTWHIQHIGHQDFQLIFRIEITVNVSLDHNIPGESPKYLGINMPLSSPWVKGKLPGREPEFEDYNWSCAQRGICVMLKMQCWGGKPMKPATWDPTSVRWEQRKREVSSSEGNRKDGRSKRVSGWWFHRSWIQAYYSDPMVSLLSTD